MWEQALYFHEVFAPTLSWIFPNSNFLQIMTAFSGKTKSSWFHTFSNPAVFRDLKHYNKYAWREISISLPDLPVWNWETIYFNQEPGDPSL